MLIIKFLRKKKEIQRIFVALCYNCHLPDKKVLVKPEMPK